MKADRSAENRCPNCGTNRPPGWAICPTCGQKHARRWLPAFLFASAYSIVAIVVVGFAALCAVLAVFYAVFMAFLRVCTQMH